MADIFYATLELKNIRMEGLLFSFLEKYDKTRYSATEFGRNKPMNFRPSGTLNVRKTNGAVKFAHVTAPPTVVE